MQSNGIPTRPSSSRPQIHSQSPQQPGRPQPSPTSWRGPFHRLSALSERLLTNRNARLRKTKCCITVDKSSHYFATPVWRNVCWHGLLWGSPDNDSLVTATGPRLTPSVTHLENIKKKAWLWRPHWVVHMRPCSCSIKAEKILCQKLSVKKTHSWSEHKISHWNCSCCSSLSVLIWLCPNEFENHLSLSFSLSFSLYPVQPPPPPSLHHSQSDKGMRVDIMCPSHKSRL